MKTQSIPTKVKNNTKGSYAHHLFNIILEVLAVVAKLGKEKKKRDREKKKKLKYPCWQLESLYVGESKHSTRRLLHLSIVWFVAAVL